MTPLARKASLAIDLNPAFTPLVLDFAEGSARAFGMEDADIAKVRLASEEVFEYLCRTAKGEREFRVEATSRIYEMELRFVFTARGFDPYVFNLTAKIGPDEQDIESLGLLIAARSVDRFSMRYQGDRFSLVLVKEKTYPPYAPEEQESARPLQAFSVKIPEAQLVRRFVAAASRSYPTLSFPPRFRSPAKMVDMMESGDYRAIVATGTGVEGADIAGGLVWRPLGKSMVEFYGPYVCAPTLGPEIALSLTERFLAAVAKTDAIGVISQNTTPELPRGQLEPLGAIGYRLPQGANESRFFFYRQLREDAGSYVWADDSLAGFLQAAYDRLVLPRQVLTPGDDEERIGPHSVFAVQFNRPLDSVTIRPVLDGTDRAKNIAEYVAVLTKEGVGNIFAELDIGAAWQARLASVLSAQGFAPVLLVPYGGEQGDVVIFQHAGPSA